MTHPLCVLTALAHAAMVTQSAPQGRGTPLFAVLTFVSLGVWAWLGRRQGRLTRELTAAQAQAKAAVEALAGYKKSQATKSSGNQDRLKETTQALAAQKKKNYTQGQKLTAALADKAQAEAQAQEAMAQAQKARRQLEQADLAPRQNRIQAAPVVPEVKTLPEILVAPEPVVAEALIEPSVAPEPDAAAESARLAQVEAEAAQAQLLGDARTQAKEAKNKLKEVRQQVARLSKRLEDQRRVDLMSRGKIGVLEDKLRRMGRDYYETISALAIARGEVVPPRPQSKSRNTASAAPEQGPTGGQTDLLIPQSQRPS